MTTYGSKMIKAVIRHIVKAVNKASQSRWFPMAFVIYSINCKARFHKPDCRTYFQSQHLYQIKFFFSWIYIFWLSNQINEQTNTDCSWWCCTPWHNRASWKSKLSIPDLLEAICMWKASIHANSLYTPAILFTNNKKLRNKQLLFTKHIYHEIKILQY